MVDSYLKKIAAITKRGDAREESYYPALAQLLETYSETRRKKKAQVTVLPKKTEAGNPDFRIWDTQHTLVGYVEAKPPGANLDDIETSEQLTRYLSTFPNLILTDYYEFRLYRKGRRVGQVLLARRFVPAKLRLVPPAERLEEFFALLETFFHYSLPKDFTAESLARELAVRTRFLRDQIIKEELREETASGPRKILGFYEAFRKHLIAHLTKDDFADLYAQTITYGLFAARTRATGPFQRRLAYDLIPKTIGILREIFHFVSFDPPEQVQATVDDIAEVLAVADVKRILAEYFQRGKGADPIFHFYETFLAAYNPEERERRGVYYTPEAVVSFIVRSVHAILKEKFGHKDGLAKQNVTVLDPAGGTLTFIAEAAKLAVREFEEKYGWGSKSEFVKDHILEHFFAFELMMAPYAAGHLKMGYLLEELGYKLTGDERFPFFLTNTLELEDLAQSSLPGMRSLSEESRLAGQVKKERPILVILGNPPYSGISANASERLVEVKKGQKYVSRYLIEARDENGRKRYILIPDESEAKKTIKVKQKTWIGELIEYYKVVDGRWFGERKHWLQDDYVKFIRFAQWKIDQIGEGIVGFITNHSYLDNPTFRGMRQSLMNSFDEIHVLDLHGNSLKKERAPDGSKDENVFDIQQGVAIVILIKHKERTKSCDIQHSGVWGSREKKYQYLNSHDIRSVSKTKLRTASPYYYFIPKQTKHKDSWERFPGLSGIFPTNVTGIITARDDFVIDLDQKQLEVRMIAFRNMSLDDEFIRSSYNLRENYMWRIKEARRKLAKVDDWSAHFSKILYRPFDIRHIYFHPSVVWRTRSEVMRHMLQPNLSLCAMRQVSLHGDYSHFLASSYMVDNRTFKSSKGIIQQYPLYLYTDIDKHDLFSKAGSQGRVPNIVPEFFEILSRTYGKRPSPEEIFHYMYAILYSERYRRKYGEFLKSDFPRVPFTADYSLFKKLAEKGEGLTGLHLLQSPKLDKPVVRFEGSGDQTVHKVRHDEKSKKAFINQTKYFFPLPKDIWEYQIGGYRVAEKWLKDRKGRILSSAEVGHYCRVITALAETMKIQGTLDDLFEAVEKTVLEVNLAKTARSFPEK